MPKPITTLTSIGIPLPLDNVDTDQIIPARFLTVTDKAGLGDAVFSDLRYHADGSPKEDFPLNQAPYKQGQILIAGDNFGCGSSREHAPWALTDFGIRAILAESFADIFNNNALKNGLVPIVLPKAILNTAIQKATSDTTSTITVDLPSQTVTFPAAWGIDMQPFEIDSFRKTCLMEGLDDIGYSLKVMGNITTFETAYDAKHPAPTLV